MTIEERDSLRSDGASRSGWRRLKWRGPISAAALLVAVVSGGLWMARDAAWLFQPKRAGEGSLVVNINSATAAELETLPGIGPALAQLIIEGRPYQTIEELDRVRGIGPILFTSLRPLVRIDGTTEKLAER